MGVKANKLGSWYKHPAYCQDLNVNVWHMPNGINGMVYIFFSVQLKVHIIYAKMKIENHRTLEHD